MLGLFLVDVAAAWPTLDADLPAHGGGEADAAVVVGIEDYFAAPDVAGARRNAEDWFRYLTKVRGVPPARAVLLRDSEATDAAIRQALTDATQAVDQGGTLWVVFIGHGAPSTDGTDGLLVGVDAQQTALGLASRSVPRSELLEAIGAGKQAESVVVLDACFSGRTSAGEPLAPGLQPMIPTHASQTPGEVILMTAAASDQFAGPLPGEGRPAFSYLVLGALQGWGDADADGQVTASEASSFASEALQITVRDRLQTPQLATDRGSAVLGVGFRTPPDMAELAIDPDAAFAPKVDPVPVPVPPPVPQPVVRTPEPATATVPKPTRPARVPSGPRLFRRGTLMPVAPEVELMAASTSVLLGGDETTTHAVRFVTMDIHIFALEVRLDMPHITWGQTDGTPRDVAFTMGGGLGAEVLSTAPKGRVEWVRLGAGLYGTMISGGEAWGPYVANTTRFSRIVGVRAEWRPVVGSSSDALRSTVGAGFVFGLLGE